VVTKGLPRRTSRRSRPSEPSRTGGDLDQLARWLATSADSASRAGARAGPLLDAGGAVGPRGPQPSSRDIAALRKCSRQLRRPSSERRASSRWRR
jgi:hypothetical protein